MATKHVSIAWFEIPAKDLDRAATFYEKVFETKLEDMQAQNGMLKAFGSDRGPIGAIVAEESNAPSREGALLYLATDDIEATLARVADAGGEVLVGKTSIGPYGFIAHLLDTEGNRIALHSR